MAQGLPGSFGPAVGDAVGTLAPGETDGVDGRQVQHVEAHAARRRPESRRDIIEGAVAPRIRGGRAGEELVPGTAPGASPVGEDAEGGSTRWRPSGWRGHPSGRPAGPRRARRPGWPRTTPRRSDPGALESRGAPRPEPQRHRGAAWAIGEWPELAACSTSAAPTANSTVRSCPASWRSRRSRRQVAKGSTAARMTKRCQPVARIGHSARQRSPPMASIGISVHLACASWRTRSVARTRS